MADLQNFATTAGVAVQVNVPKYTISCKVTDSGTGAVLADFTGDNALQFPSVLSTLTGDQYAAIMDLIANTLIHMKAGL